MHPNEESLWKAVNTIDDRITALVAVVETHIKANSPHVMKATIVSALREAAQDPEITRATYDAMSKHARSSLAQYVGERVLTALAVLAVSAVLAWQWFKGLK